MLMSGRKCGAVTASYVSPGHPPRAIGTFRTGPVLWRAQRAERLAAGMRMWRRSSMFAAAAIISTFIPTVGVGVSHAAPAPPSDAPVTDPWLADLAIDVRPNIRDDFADFGPTSGSEVAISGASTWHAAGSDGTGVKIGVIDFFDVALYWKPAEHGPTPVPGVTAKCLNAGADCTSDFFDGVDRGDERHGVAVVEIIKDMAPGAQIYIARGLTLDDYVSIIDWFASVGVTVINRSLGS